MALDTLSKRASSDNLLQAYALALKLPDGTVSQADRQQSAWAYSGILAAGGAPPPTRRHERLVMVKVG